MELEFIKNNVEANDQVSAFYYLEGDKNAELKVMFIGNSITIHEPKPEIGWHRCCGMAASNLEHDYVHLVYKYLLTKHKSVSVCVFNGGRWELDYTNTDKANSIIYQIKDYNPDIVIIRIGENFNKEYLSEGKDPYLAFDYLIKAAKEATDNVIVTSLFWEYEYLDSQIEKAAKDNKAKYVYLTDLSKDKTNEAIGQFEHQGICLHPNDRGMREIANRIIKLLE